MKFFLVSSAVSITAALLTYLYALWYTAQQRRLNDERVAAICEYLATQGKGFHV